VEFSVEWRGEGRCRENEGLRAVRATFVQRHHSAGARSRSSAPACAPSPCVSLARSLPGRPQRSGSSRRVRSPFSPREFAPRASERLPRRGATRGHARAWASARRDGRRWRGLEVAPRRLDDGPGAPREREPPRERRRGCRLPRWLAHAAGLRGCGGARGQRLPSTDRASRAHQRQRLLHGEERSFDVDIEDVLERRLGDATERRRLGYPRVREHDVEAPLLLTDGRDDAIEVVELRDVALERSHVVADPATALSSSA
jgi:hypothetical protein